MRVVIDTNVLVSSAVSEQGAPARIFRQWAEGAFELLISEEILAEYRRALGYERVRKRHGYAPDRIDAVIADLRRSATFIIPVEALNVVTQDPDDNKILECAVAGGADYIISGDTHLLDLKEYQGIQILPPAAFLMVL